MSTCDSETNDLNDGEAVKVTLTVEDVEKIRAEFGVCTKKLYHNMIAHISSKLMGGRPELFGMNAAEIYHNAVISLFDKVDSDPEFFEGCFRYGFEGMFVSWITKDSRFTVSKLKRRFVIGIKNEEQVAALYGDPAFASRRDGVKAAEDRDLISSLSPSFVTLIRCLENGDSIDEIRRKVGIGSVSTYYKVLEVLRDDLIRLGFKVEKF